MSTEDDFEHNDPPLPGPRHNAVSRYGVIKDSAKHAIQLSQSHNITPGLSRRMSALAIVLDQQQDLVWKSLSGLTDREHFAGQQYNKAIEQHNTALDNPKLAGQIPAKPDDWDSDDEGHFNEEDVSDLIITPEMEYEQAWLDARNQYLKARADANQWLHEYMVNRTARKDFQKHDRTMFGPDPQDRVRYMIRFLNRVNELRTAKGGPGLLDNPSTVIGRKRKRE